MTTDLSARLTDMLSAAGPVSRVRIIGAVKAGYDALALEEDLGSALAEVKNAENTGIWLSRAIPWPRISARVISPLSGSSPSLQNGDLGVVIYGDNEATLKKYYYSDGAVTLVPFNDAYQTVTLRGHELERLMIVGKVVETKTKW